MATPTRGSSKSRTQSIRRHGRRDSGDAFMPDPESGVARAPDDLAEVLAESYLISATSGEEHGEEALDEIVVEEIGGPFVEDGLVTSADLTSFMQADIDGTARLDESDQDDADEQDDDVTIV